MSDIVLKKISYQSQATIHLTGSKSESNRALILEALSEGKIQIKNLSSAADTVTLNQILKNNHLKNIADVGPAGTAMRFLTAFFAVTEKKITLTGTERMKQRPIGILVNALNNLGADISYVEKENYPPLAFNGKFNQLTNHISISGDISSQYITALLLVASSLPLGLEVNIEGELTSKPYVDMTLSMLQQCGINFSWINEKISIPSQNFSNTTITIEPDWSAASYWYLMVSLSENGEINLPFLKEDSLQGDSAIRKIMHNFGVNTTFSHQGLTIKKVPIECKEKSFNLKECPDLAQTIIVCCALLGINASFTGLETLKIKETDRINALQNELAKIGVTLKEDEGYYNLDSSQKIYPKSINIKTYEDHRMAMAFAPLAMVIDEVIIEDADVVEKSYPHFWDDFKLLGFDVQTII